MMRNALSQLDLIPDEDVDALRKMNEGELPALGSLERPVLLIVDMVEAFVRDRYPTGWEKTGSPCAESIAAVRSAAKSNGVPVIYTTAFPTGHPALIGSWWRSGREAPPPPFALGEASRSIVAELTPATDDIVLEKAKPSAFFGTQLAGVLNRLRAHSLIVTGMTTSGCVRATAVDAFSLNYAPVIPLECTADRAQFSHQASLFDIGSKYGDVPTTESVITSLNASS